MADRLVHLQLHLLRVDHDGRHARRAYVGAQKRGSLLCDARCLALEAEVLDVLPAALRGRAAVRGRIRAHLEDAVARGERVDPAAGLDELLLDLGAVGGDEHLVLALRADERLA